MIYNVFDDETEPTVMSFKMKLNEMGYDITYSDETLLTKLRF